MREQKVHLKLKGKALCGTKAQKRKLKFVDSEDAVTCINCKRAIEK
jgi:hypothetical protein